MDRFQDYGKDTMSAVQTTELIKGRSRNFRCIWNNQWRLNRLIFGSKNLKFIRLQNQDESTLSNWPDTEGIGFQREDKPKSTPTVANQIQIQKIWTQNVSKTYWSINFFTTCLTLFINVQDSLTDPKLLINVHSMDRKLPHDYQK